MIIYTLNTGISIESVPASDQVIDRLRTLTEAGGDVLDHAPFRVTVVHGNGSSMFTICWASAPVATCALAWTGVRQISEK